MALLRCLLFHAILGTLLSDTIGQVDDRGEQTDPLISAVLDHLNANPNKVFDYNRGTLLNAENKGSVIEVSVEVEVSCNNNYPDIPCNEHTLICNAFMGRNALPPDGYMVLSDVRCSPRIEITMEEADDSIVGAPQANEDQRLDLSNEALQPGQERADFVAIRNKNDLCLGCPWDLNTDAEGVDELVDGALKHIESEKTQRLKITKVRRLQQEIVAGVKFILLAEVAQTTCQKDAEQSAVCAVDENTEPLVCEVTFIEQSWISKGKHIIKNNCTISQEFEPVHYSSSRRNDESNEIVPHKDLDISNPDGVQKREGHNFDAIAQTGNIESLIDPDHLADLESQILVDSFDTDTKVDNRKLLSTPHGQNNRFTVDEPLLISKDINVEPLSLQAQPLRTLYASIPIVDEAEPTGVSYIQQKDDLLNVLFDNDLPEARTVADSAEHPPPTRIDRNSFEERQFKRGAKNDSSSSESSESKSSSDSKSSEESKKPSQSVTLNGTDEGVTAKTKRHVEDTNESTSDSKDSSEEKNRPTRDTEDTNESASDSKDSSEERQRSRRDVAEMRETEPIIRKKRIVGQLEKILPEEKIIVRDLADFAATSMDNTDDDQHKRVILQILGAKKLKLDGIYYQIILRLGISHCNENEHNENCREKLFTNMTKICKVQVHVEDDYSNPKVVKSQCQNIKKDENDRNRTNYSRYRREVLVGAPSNLPVDHPQVKKIVKDTLIRLDSVSGHPNKHKSVEVVSATRQVVAGLRYVVTAKIGITYCKKSDEQLPETCNLLSDIEPETCTIVTLEQPWRNKTYLTVKCNDKVYDFGNVDDHARVKREPCVGCPVQLELSEAEKYLNIGLTHLDSTSNTGNRYISEEILNATTQVVAGQLVTVKARITESNCPKSTSVPKDCSKLEGRASQVCTFEIWEKTWLNFTKTDVYCDNGQNFTHTEVLYDDGPKEKRSKRDISDDELESVLEAGLQYLSEKRHLPGEYKFVSGPDGLFRKLKLNDGTWQIDANIKLCQKRDLSACHAQAQSFCQFTVKRTESVLDGLKMTIKCDNDDEVYVYEPVSKLRDPELLKNGFLEFAKKYNKQYKNDNEFNFRLKVFRYNLDKIDFLNRFERGTARYGITQFADLTETEFSRSHGYRSDLRNDNELPFAAATIPNIELPTGFDWRTKGAVTEVKNQGLCGSCWAFSVTGNVEGQYALKHSSLLEFSEQELVDCDKVDEGCNGGLMDNAYRVIEKLGGLETESDYPYQGADEGCIFNKGKVKVQVTGAVNISHNETDMAKWLVQNGPISIAINANAMQFYFGGISHPWELLCDPSDLDHGVLIVGYGVHSYALFNRTIPYWIVKNSWGPSWGEQGYYRVFRGDGTCGLNQTPSSAIVA